MGDNRMHYTCAACKEEFVGELTPEEAKAQFYEEFPGEEWNPDMPVVCDDCHKRLLAIYQHTPKEGDST